MVASLGLICNPALTAGAARHGRLVDVVHYSQQARSGAAGRSRGGAAPPIGPPRSRVRAAAQVVVTLTAERPAVSGGGPGRGAARNRTVPPPRSRVSSPVPAVRRRGLCRGGGLAPLRLQGGHSPPPPPSTTG